MRHEGSVRRVVKEVGVNVVMFYWFFDKCGMSCLCG